MSDELRETKVVRESLEEEIQKLRDEYTKKIENLEIRHNKAKGKLTLAEEENKELSSKVAQYEKDLGLLMSSRDRADNQLVETKNEILRLREENMVATAASKAGARDLDYIKFAWTQYKSSLESDARPEVDQFIDQQKVESKAKGINLFGEKDNDIPATTSGVHSTANPPSSGNKTATVSDDEVWSKLKEKYKHSLGAMVNISDAKARMSKSK